MLVHRGEQVSQRFFLRDKSEVWIELGTVKETGGPEEVSPTMGRKGDRMRDMAGQGGRRVLVGLLLVVMGLTMGAVPAQADEQGVVRLEVVIGKSQVVELKEPFTRVSVTNPGIADVFVVTPNQILVSGKAGGH